MGEWQFITKKKGSKKNNGSSKAVSPVIGVMLMLIITVILAAAVSAFTGSLQIQNPTPTAKFDVRIVKNATTDRGNVSFIQITELAGDRIPTKDLEIITYNPDANGSYKVMVVKPNSGNTHYINTSGDWVNGTSPYYNNKGVGLFGISDKVDFGNYTVTPGSTMVADWWAGCGQSKWNASSGWYNGPNVTGFCACIADGWNVTPGHYITVKIVYTPTHTIIWQNKVIVEGEGI